MGARAARRAGLVAMVAVVIALVAGAKAYPALAAVACPWCYGLERAEERLLVGAEMPRSIRDGIAGDLASARKAVAGVLGPTEARPFILACSTNACDRRVGGHGDRGARAEAFTTPFLAVVRFGPRGLDRTILEHELAHVTMHEIVGAGAVMDGRFPAWLNEGLAVIVSNDERYLRPGRTADERCRIAPEGPLPASPFEWAPAAGRDPSIYARSACAALHWLEANRGVPGLLDRLKHAARTGGSVTE